MKIKTKGVISDVFWSFFQRGGSLIISFVSNMVLARLLTPDDFGCVGIILIFVSFADLLIDSGLGSALIQKKEISQKDIDTVFTTNFAISVFLYILIFISAPFFARYFKIQNLDLYLRVVSIAIFFRAFFVIQSADLLKNLKFKQLSINGIIATAGSVIVAIVMALKGFGVWSLIAKNMIHPFLTCILYRISSSVSGRFRFDKQSFKQLFGYGWFVALTSFIDVLYSNTVSFIVGKRYSAKDLGYFNQANSLQQIPTYSLAMVIKQVLFPHMARIHDDRELMKEYSQRVMIVATFVIFPVMMYLISFAKPIIVLLYSSKWLPSAIFFQVLCLEGIVHSMIHIHRQILMAIGETKLLFRIQLIVFAIGIVLLFIAKEFSIIALVWALVLTTFINWIILAIITGKRIGYSLYKQIIDIAPAFFISLLPMLLIRLVMDYCNFHIVLTLLISGILFLIIYLGASYLLKTKGFKMTYAMCFKGSK
jgi:O-antigen/teichoic acid export membrane protein